MKIVFFGTPDFATASLEALVQNGYEVSLVVTQPDRRAGRGQKVSQPSVKSFALAHGLAIEQPKKIRNPEFLEKLRSTKSKLFVVAAYGRLLPKEVLAIPELILNIHASLLPRWRGAAPIARSILEGDAKTGISIMKIVEELDAGDVLLQQDIPIGENETAGELTGRLAKVGGQALIAALKKVEEGELRFVPQDVSRVTFAPQIKAQEGKIDWEKSAKDIHAQVRAFNPWPGCSVSDGKQRIKLFRTEVSDETSSDRPTGSLRVEKGRLWLATQSDWLEILELQREGKARQETKKFLPGYLGVADKRWI